MDPALFHQENCGSAPPDRMRDAAEMELVRLFAAHKAPIFGICRGLQVLNVTFGGDIIQDIATAGAHRGYTENGKLQIDETKLKTALDTKGSEIKALFTSDNGIAVQLNNIINGAAKTSGVKGSRGSLVEAAGYASTASDSENYITAAMTRTSKYISSLQLKLTDEESRLWSKFTAMETALQQLNVQSSMLTQFSGGSSN
ncbi:hypothetical protein SDC9_183818 [bioreactor metagenome]|uniref:Uncharacterized protein n=1 Tax=bioreactor metagenome TaxID=1076179 RepID=A0A645HDV4_9ZZZZ